MLEPIQSISTSIRCLFAASAAAFMLVTFGAIAADGSPATQERKMDTGSVIHAYFDTLGRNDAWQVWLADDMAFTSFTSPVKHVNGKSAYLQATQRFYGSIRKVELRQLLVEGDRACALTRYELQPSNGAPAFMSDVAEVFRVRDGKIISFEIYFDSAPFPK